MTSAFPNQIGSLIFCSRCGNLLDLPGDEDHLVCDGCGQVEDATGASFRLRFSFLSILADLSLLEQLTRARSSPPRATLLPSRRRCGSSRPLSSRTPETSTRRRSTYVVQLLLVACFRPLTTFRFDRSTRRARSVVRSKCRSRRCSCGRQTKEASLSLLSCKALLHY
jgi:DNA-directed RNA polymerase subunit M/transcription elongation factor TFIIS